MLEFFREVSVISDTALPDLRTQEYEAAGGEEGAEAGAAAAVRVLDQERDRSPRGRLQMEEVRPESCQEQSFPKVIHCFTCLLPL